MNPFDALNRDALEADPNEQRRRILRGLGQLLQYRQRRPRQLIPENIFMGERKNGRTEAVSAMPLLDEPVFFQDQ
jgi:hypothetical protein